MQLLILCLLHPHFQINWFPLLDFFKYQNQKFSTEMCAALKQRTLLVFWGCLRPYILNLPQEMIAGTFLSLDWATFIRQPHWQSQKRLKVCIGGTTRQRNWPEGYWWQVWELGQVSASSGACDWSRFMVLGYLSGMLECHCWEVGEPQVPQLDWLRIAEWACAGIFAVTVRFQNQDRFWISK